MKSTQKVRKSRWPFLPQLERIGLTVGILFSIGWTLVMGIQLLNYLGQLLSMANPVPMDWFGVILLSAMVATGVYVGVGLFREYRELPAKAAAVAGELAPPAGPQQTPDGERAPKNDLAKALFDALLSAYPTRAPLERMVRFDMNENLATICPASSQEDTIFSLIMWAEQYGRLDELVEAAYQQNPTNPDLRRFWEGYILRASGHNGRRA